MNWVPDNLLCRLSKSPPARRLATAVVRSYLRYFPVAAGKEALWNRVVDPYLAWHSHPFVARTRFGACMAGDTRDMIQQYVYFFGFWEPDLTGWITSRLQPGDVFVDVGANIGYYSLLASGLVGDDGKVVSVEASPAIFRQLRGNLDRNRSGNVRAVNVAASDCKARLQLFRGPSHNIGETSLFQADGFTADGMVEAAPLADILEAGELARARLLKIDVEGAEAAVLRGLVPMLGRMRADLELIVEFHPQYLTQPGQSAEDLVKLLRGAGFHAARLENDYWPFAYLRNRSIKRPTPLRTPITGETVIVFSRQDPSGG